MNIKSKLIQLILWKTAAKKNIHYIARAWNNKSIITSVMKVAYLFIFLKILTIWEDSLEFTPVFL